MNWHREYPPDTRRTSWPRGTLVLVFLVTVLVMLVLMRAIDPPEAGTPYNAKVDAGSGAVGAFWALEAGAVILAIVRGYIKVRRKMHGKQTRVVIRNAAPSAATLKAANPNLYALIIGAKKGKVNEMVQRSN